MKEMISRSPASDNISVNLGASTQSIIERAVVSARALLNLRLDYFHGSHIC